MSCRKLCYGFYERRPTEREDPAGKEAATERMSFHVLPFATVVNLHADERAGLVRQRAFSHHLYGYFWGPVPRLIKSAGNSWRLSGFYVNS